MSQAALLLAVRDYLRENLSNVPGVPDAASWCDITPEGKPNAMMGEEFISIHEDGWATDNGDYDLDETHQVLVTVTRQTGQYPPDQLGPYLLANLADGTLSSRVDEIRVKVHNNEQIRLNANDLLGTSVNGFIQVLKLQRVTKLSIKQAEWFWGHREKRKEINYAEQQTPCGVARTLVFGGIRRIQTIESMT